MNNKSMEEIADQIICSVIAKIIPSEIFCKVAIYCKIVEIPERMIKAIIGEKSKFAICKGSLLKIFKYGSQIFPKI